MLMALAFSTLDFFFSFSLALLDPPFSLDQAGSFRLKTFMDIFAAVLISKGKIETRGGGGGAGYGFCYCCGLALGCDT